MSPAYPCQDFQQRRATPSTEILSKKLFPGMTTLLAELGGKAGSSAICDARCETLLVQVRLRKGEGCCLLAP